MAMSERMCSIESCERPYIAKGLCSSHYARKAQAAAWDEGYEAGMFDTYRLGRDMELTITPAPNPYRETGDRA